MMFCQFGHCHSVRDLSNGLRSATGNLNHLGIVRGPSKSTIAYANKHHKWKVFERISYNLLDETGPKFPRHRIPKVRLKSKFFSMDSTLISLCIDAFDSAHYRRAKGAIKLHTVLDYDGLLPIFIDMNDGKHTMFRLQKRLIFLLEACF